MDKRLRRRPHHFQSSAINSDALPLKETDPFQTGDRIFCLREIAGNLEHFLFAEFHTFFTGFTRIFTVHLWLVGLDVWGLWLEPIDRSLRLIPIDPHRTPNIMDVTSRVQTIMDHAKAEGGTFQSIPQLYPIYYFIITYSFILNQLQEPHQTATTD